MTKKILLTLLLAIVAGVEIQGKTIKYSDFLKYEGELDANNRPKGKGKLTTSCRVLNPTTKSYEKTFDILEGEFDGSNVTNAKLYFDSDKKNQSYKSVYKGTLKYIIEKNGTDITYEMFDGVFTDNVPHDYIITSKKNIAINRYLKKDGSFDWFATSLLPSTEQDVAPATLIEQYPELKDLESLGISKCYSSTSNELGQNWKGVSKNTIYVMEFGQAGCYVVINNNKIDLHFANGNYMYSNGLVTRHLPDGTAFSAIRQQNTLWDGRLVYANNHAYVGTFTIANLVTFSDLIAAKSLNDFSITYGTGFLLKDGVQIQYTNGKTAEELAVEAAVRKKEEEAKAAAAAKAREKEEAERAAAAKKEAAQRAQTTKSTNNWDSVLNSYEKFVNQYVAFYKKAMNGDITALAKYPSLLKQAQELDAKLSRAKGELTEAQMARYMKILNKMTSIIQ